MEHAVIAWGFILTMYWPGMPPIKDPNFGAAEKARCEQVASDLMAMRPTLVAYCDPTWKPEAAPKKPQQRRRRYASSRYHH
jgi:hypothetical protein